MSRRVYTFVTATVAAALAILVVAGLLGFQPLQWTWWGAGFLLLGMILAEAGAVELTRESDHALHVISVSTIPHIAAALLLPPGVAAAVAGVAMLVDERRNGRPLLQMSFNVAVTTGSVGLAALQAHLLGINGDRLGNGDWLQVPGLLLIVLTYYVTNTVPVAGVAALVGGRSFWRSAAQQAVQTAPAMPALAVIGALAAFVWVKDPRWLLAGLIPALVSQLTLRYIAARNRKAEHLAALERLGRRLSGGLSADEVFTSLSEQVRQVRGVDACFLCTEDPQQVFQDGLGISPAAVELIDYLVEQASAGREQIDRDSAAIAADGSNPLRSWLTLTVQSDSSPIAWFGVASEQARAFSRDDVEFFRLVAERIGLALEATRRASELVRMAYHDALTGLPNRALLLDRIEQVLLRQRDGRRPAAVLVLDLDNFKLINDTLGHHAGDSLLVAVTEALTEAVRPGDTVARLGGDEFVVLLPEIDDAEMAAAIADRLSKTLRREFVLADRNVVISTSIGVAVSNPGDNQRPDRLLQNADLALYQAKDNGRARYELFKPHLETSAVERLEVESDLRVALERQELDLHYQPIVDLDSGSIVGWEALLRWHHVERGSVPPNAFIPVAEATGLIVPIGRWVLETACRQLAQWLESTHVSSLTMSVNVAARQFQDPNLIEDIARVVRQSGIPPRCLKLEITESAVMQDARLAEQTLRELKKLGVQIAIDDFGTGYSSLSYLKRFPVDTLKIDRSFVDGLGHDAQSTAIVRSIVVLAKTLELSTTAEGIETPGQYAQLRLMGCDTGQGYLSGRPVTAERAQQLFVEQHGGAARSAA